MTKKLFSVLLLAALALNTQAQITVDAANQLGASTVSKYLATNEDGIDRTDSVLKSAFTNIGIKHVKLWAWFDYPYYPIDVTGSSGNLTLNFTQWDQRMQEIRDTLQANTIISIGNMPKVISSGDTTLPDYGDYPPLNWDDWDTIVRKLVQHNVAMGWTGLYYEIWNEPELRCAGCYWVGTYADYINLYVRAARAVKLADPTAKVGNGAPGSWDDWWEGVDTVLPEPFLKNLIRSVSLITPVVPMDFISWHHYRTEYLSEGADTVDSWVAEIGFPANPEYLVTEWNSEYGQLPANDHPWPLKASFTAANIIQQVNTPRVWPFFFTFQYPYPGFGSEYQTGLLSMTDFTCKRPTYAAFQMMYAMAAGNRISHTAPTGLDVLAIRNDSTQKVIATVANFNSTGNNQVLTFNNLPFTTATVYVKEQWITSITDTCTGLEAGTITNVPVTAGSVTLPTLNLPDYSVVQITLSPIPFTGMVEPEDDGIEISIQPNPNKGKFQVSSVKFKVESIEIYNVLGEKVYQSFVNSHLSLGNSTMTIDLSSQPAGIYFLNISLNKKKHVKKMEIVRE